jgi:hypothetical protein
MCSGSGSDSQKVPDPVLNPTIFLKKAAFKGLKLAFLNILFNEYLNLIY